MSKDYVETTNEYILEPRFDTRKSFYSKARVQAKITKTE